MFNLVVASGKGGTGKTTVAVNLALSMREKDVQLLDCDVEEPNAHLFLDFAIEESREVSIPVPSVDPDRCSYCGRCSEVCSFNAMAVFRDRVMILPELCHGCGSCAYLCAENAIVEVERPIGNLESGTASGLAFSLGRLNPGEAMSPPLINAVKSTAKARFTTIIDAPPGTSCPVVTAVKGSDFCLLVTEPTPFGLNDLDLAYQMVSKMGIPAGVLINRCDLGDGGVDDYCFKNNLPVLQKIPWSREAAALYARGKNAVEYLPAWKELFQDLAGKLAVIIKEAGRP